MAIDYKDIGQRIKAKRIEKGLTQEKLSEQIYDSSLLLQYLDKKMKAVHGNSKTRRSLANIYAIYSILHFYQADFYNQPDRYRNFGGYDYMKLFNHYRSLYGGSKLQNHALNSRVNGEFKNKFPTIKSTTQGLFDTNLKALESVGVDATNGFYETKNVEFDGVDENTVWSRQFHGVTFNGYDTYYKAVTKGEKYRVTTSVVHNDGYAAVIICDTDNKYYSSVLPYSSGMDGLKTVDFTVPCDGYIRVCTSTNPVLQQYVGKTFNPDSQKNYYVSVNDRQYSLQFWMGQHLVESSHGYHVAMRNYRPRENSN